MASKRKREGDEGLISTPASKVAKQEEVTRSGRVRKKPAKFADDESEDKDKEKEAVQTPVRPSQPVLKTPPTKPPAPVLAAPPQVAAPPPVVVTAPPPAIVAVPVVPAPPVPVPVQVQQIKEEPVEMMDEQLGEDELGGKTPSRSSRARKKSAKVLEMEEFEEAEKKQFGKKTGGADTGKKAVIANIPQSPTSVSKKQKTVHTTMPVTAALAAKLLSSAPSGQSKPDSGVAAPVTQVAPGIASLAAHLKAAEKPAQIKTEPMSPSRVKLEAVSPVKASPLKTSAGVHEVSQNVQVKTEPGLSGPGSVIKLLLSSPAQNTNPVLSTKSVTNSSPPQDKAGVQGKKKGKSKAKAGTAPQAEAEAVPMQTLTPQVPQELTKLKMALGKLKAVSVDTNLPQLPTSPQQEGLKMKFILSPKKESGETQVVTQAVQGSADPLQKPQVTKAKPNKEVKQKKTKKVTMKDDSAGPMVSAAAMSPPLRGSVENRGETEKKKKTPKSKTSKEKVEMEKNLMDDEFGLDLSEIPLGTSGNDSLMDMDEEDSLIMSDEALEPIKPKPASKPAKKKPRAKDPTTLTVQIGEIPNADGDLVMDFERMKGSEKKTKKKMTETLDVEKTKKKRAPTAYMIWCYEHRPKLVKDNPGIDFSTISKRLGEMWSSLSDKEKMVWKRKAKKAAGKGSTLITTGKGGGGNSAKQGQITQQTGLVPGPSQTAQVSKSAAVVSAALAKAGKPALDEVVLSATKGFGIEPVDVASYLKILGESLSIIGMRLQEHRGLIAVQGSLSVLLDSMLCACSPLLALTAQLPETNGCTYETHMKTLDNVAYIMPGL